MFEIIEEARKAIGTLRDKALSHQDNLIPRLVHGEDGKSYRQSETELVADNLYTKEYLILHRVVGDLEGFLHER